MTMMATMSIYGKILKNLLQNQKADDLETWYAALGATYFTARSSLVPYALVLEKGKTNFSETIVWFETSNRWPKWQEVSVDIRPVSPGGCMPPAPGLYTY